MEYKHYIWFLSQIVGSSSGYIDEDGLRLIFTWLPEQASVRFSVLLTSDSCSTPRKLMWSNEQPFFEQRENGLFLTQKIKGVPTYIEFKALTKNFIGLVQEFNDQSMGSFAQLLR